MASVISTKPYVGFASGVIFGFLGVLLIGIDTVPGGSSRIAAWLFRIVGSFLLFVAVSSVAAAVQSLRNNSKMKRTRGGG